MQTPKSGNAEVDAFLQDKTELFSLIQEQLLRAHCHMKFFVDKHRIECEFKVGDQVYLCLQPYCQSIVALHRNLKITAHYYGPYPILECVGQVVYKLGLFVSSKIHLVFHVS